MDLAGQQVIILGCRVVCGACSKQMVINPGSKICPFCRAKNEFHEVEIEGTSE